MNFEDARAKAEEKAKKVGKQIMAILENDDYWYFEAGLPYKKFFDDGAGSIYVNKKDGSVIPCHLWLPEVQKLNAKFEENFKIIYNYYNENKYFF